MRAITKKKINEISKKVIDSSIENIKEIDNSIKESALNNIEFWMDQRAIQTYCNSMISFYYKNHNIDNRKNVVVSFIPQDGTPCVVRNSSNGYTINIPMVNAMVYGEALERQLLSRNVYVKHELAHILFTDFDKMNATISSLSSNNEEFKRFINNIEDARVDFLYTKTFYGTKESFRLVFELFFDAIKDAVENSEINIMDYARYVAYRMRGYLFKRTPQTEKYEYFFINALNQGLNNIIDENFYNYVFQAFDNFYLFLNKNFIDLEEKMKANEFERKEVAINITDMIQHDFRYIHSGFIDAEKQELYIVDSKGVIPIDENNITIDKNGDRIQVDNFRSTNTTPFEQNEDDNIFDDGFYDIDDEIITHIVEKPENIEQLFEDLKNLKTVRSVGIADFELNEKIFDSSTVINYRDLMMYMSNLPAIAKEAVLNYNSMIYRYQKIINESVRFLKLKMQNKNTNRVLRAQVEGNLDQSNLREIIINPDEPRCFLRNVTKISKESIFHIMIDVSGSMNSMKLHYAVVNAVILYEICFRLNIQCSIGLFSSNVKPLIFKPKYYENNSIKGILSIISRVFNSFDGVVLSVVTNYNSYTYNLKYDFNIALNKTLREGEVIHKVELVFKKTHNVMLLKDIKDKNTPFFKEILGTLLLKARSFQRCFGGNTPEFEAVNAIYSKFKNTRTKNILFIVNDGMFADFDLKGITFSTKYSDVFSFNKDNIHYSYNAIMALFEYLEFSLTRSESQRQAYANKISLALDGKNLINMFYHIYNENASLEEAYAFVKDKSTFNKFTKNGDTYSFKANAIFVDELTSAYHDLFNTKTFVYRELLEKMRREDWKVFGFGINSSYGLKYLGPKNFAYFSTDYDFIASTFAKQLRDLF